MYTPSFRLFLFVHFFSSSFTVLMLMYEKVNKFRKKRKRWFCWLGLEAKWSKNRKVYEKLKKNAFKSWNSFETECCEAANLDSQCLKKVFGLDLGAWSLFVIHFLRFNWYLFNSWLWLWLFVCIFIFISILCSSNFSFIHLLTFQLVFGFCFLENSYRIATFLRQSVMKDFKRSVRE